MENYHYDENECHGSCGLCDDCDYRYYARADDELELFTEEELWN